MREEGWYRDPYDIHEARWFSQGTPTKLVRDGTQEAFDPPPSTPPTRPLVPVTPPQIELRAGSAPEGAAPDNDSHDDELIELLDAFAQTTPPT